MPEQQNISSGFRHGMEGRASGERGSLVGKFGRALMIAAEV
jgi:hypothetical protein